MESKFNIPTNYFKILELFRKNNLKYVLIKQNKIANKELSGLDVLFKNKNDYLKAKNILLNNNFITYWSEKNEKYKSMLVKYDKEFLLIIHLHYKISWFGLKVLDSEDIFKNSIKINKLITIPSGEDVLLIHSAHIIFETFKINDFELEIFNGLLKKYLDYSYINKQLRRNHWKKRFYLFLESIKYILKTKKNNKEFNAIFKNKKSLRFKKSFIVKTIFTKTFTNNIIINLWNILGEAYNYIRRRISLKRKGTLIALIGMNGTGKSTLSNAIIKKYQKITEKLFLNQTRYYFGWKPFLPTTKLLSKFMKKTDKKIYELAKQGPKKYDLVQELMFLYVFIEYLTRYLFIIYPKLKNRHLIVADRYFYYLYGQYSYAENSRLLRILMNIFPKPDLVFVLDADISIITKRDKAIILDEIVKGKRTLAPINLLEKQRKRYLKLKNILNAEFISTEKNIKENVDKIIEKSWSILIRKLSY